MNAKDLILSVDIGTSATKAVLFDTDARQVSIVRKDYPILAPQRGWSEQEPDVIFGAVLEALRESVGPLPAGSRVHGVSFSSQLYSVLGVDPAGNPLTNSLTWSDTRSARVAAALAGHPAARDIYQRTGCPLDAIYPLAKIRWLKENLELPAGTRFISIKEYVLFRLINRYVVDWSIASATGLFDIKKHGWDATALTWLGITPAQLSEVVPPRQIFKGWDREVIAHTGLAPDTPLIIGGGDGPLASVGVGAYSSDRLAVNVGTSAAARSVISKAQVDPQGRLWTYVVDEGVWVMGGIVSSGGLVYDWFLKNFLGRTGVTGYDVPARDVHGYAEEIASAVPAGAESLIFIPYLGGEQCPAWHPHTRGGFWGLDFRHNRGHLARAVLEGITRSIYRVAESIQSTLGLEFREIRVTGGLASSRLWLQIAADMLGSPIVVPATVEGSARGAALLGIIALGLRPGFEDFPDPADSQTRVCHREEVHAYYQKQYRVFNQLLDCTRDFHQV